MIEYFILATLITYLYLQMLKKIIAFLFVIGFYSSNGQITCDVQSNVNDICAGDDVTLSYTFTNPTDYATLFNGVDGVVEVNHNAALDFGTTNFSIEFWFNAAIANANGTLITKSTVAGVGYSIGLVGSNLTVVVSDGGAPVIITDASTISANTWYHVVVVFDRAQFCTVYLDETINSGGQVSIAALGNISNTESIGIGGPSPSSAGVSPYFNGFIDEVRIWSRDLPIGEIVSRSTSHINPDAQTGLAGYWDLNDGSGLIALDCSATGENGNLINSSSFNTTTPGLAFNFGVTWSTGDFGPTIIVLPADTTTYVATMGYCRYTCQDSIIINVLNCDSLEEEFELTSVWVPTSFTPNGDKTNDLFQVQGSFVYDYEIMIYNRYGNILYHSKNMENSWDGTFEGTRVKDDTYTYIIRYRDKNGEVHKKYGYIVVSF